MNEIFDGVQKTMLPDVTEVKNGVHMIDVSLELMQLYYIVSFDAENGNFELSLQNSSPDVK